MAEKNKVELIKESLQTPIDKPVENDAANTQTEKNNAGFVGEALNEDEKINELETQSKPEIVVLVGFEGYGKTSFVSSFYFQFLSNGKVGQYEIVDSDTLIGFERRLYLRRVQSKQQSPSVTWRTVRGEPYLLTMRLRNEATGEKLIVLSDRSGEDYTRYATQRDSVKGDKVLQNADCILFFVDCSALVGNNVLVMSEKYKDLAENLSANKMLKDDAEIVILFNKIDLINDNNRDLYIKEKKVLTQTLSDKLGRKITRTFEVVSNKEDNEELLKVLAYIVSQKKSIVQIKSVSTELDWIKSIFNL